MNSITVINAGIPGNATADVIARLDRITAERPDLVCLMLGTNDMLNSSKGVSLTVYRNNLLKIIERLRDAAGAVVLITIPPCIDGYLIERHGKEFFREHSPTDKIAQANALLHEIASAHMLPLVELNAALSADKDRYLRQLSNCGEADGVHLTPDGYAVMAALVFGCIRSNGLSSAKTVCLGDSITYGVFVEGAGTDTGECYPGQLRRLLAAK